MSRSVVIVGASVGGVRTAQALRRQGHEGRITLIGAETHLPYDKPPLSKHFLAGTWDTERVSLLTDAQAAEARLDLRLGVAASRLDLPGRKVVLADGSQVAFDVVVLATGAAARPSPWRPASGLYVLRDLDGGRDLKDALERTTGPVVIVGGGFIGAEVAGTARAAGHEVTVVDPQAAPTARVLGDEVGALFNTVHPRHGVTTRFGVGVHDITGRAGDLKVTLSDGETLPAHLVVVGIGAIANVGWLDSSGLDIEDGVLCDEFSRAFGADGVYAVGDVARWFHGGHGTHLRVEHWTNAVEQAANVAYNITHPDAPRPYLPDEYVWSDQYDWRIQIVGRPAYGTSHTLIGDVEHDPPRFAVVYADDQDAVIGAATVNWPKAMMTVRRSMRHPFDQAVAGIRDLAPATAQGRP